MSKNVAVFVDVANIFYAAKAAGVDIDYVTLLRSATAGRDFVRAYAYTGLDPENENQRQFHAFLARSGYKVVSKDIRKYGDGRIKANLDIELVVDMMRMAEKLDIAVVVSGDGDFAPAIFAVQQQGVRVEVISFRGNTSSDLIDVADTFIDIANVAKVEKGVRSGRRVAAEGDLSMTEVPDKESGVTPRRRRRPEGDRPERGTSRPSGREPARIPDQVAAAAFVALPGEKLSRGPVTAEPGPEPEVDAVAAGPAEEFDEEGNRRRRRRRGGRGRGRSGRANDAGEGALPGEPEDEAISVAAHPDEVPTLPQHSGFGSVWDSQIGMPVDAGTAFSAADLGGDSLDVDEPEVPEYLLAEQRQQGRRRGGRNDRSGRGGYRSAIDRERYGAGAGYSRGGPRSTSSRPSGGPRATVHAMQPIEQTPGGDPWSEVPPEVQELLRAELARRDAGGSGTSSARQPQRQPRDPAPATEAMSTEAPPAEAKPKRAPRKRTTAADAAEAPATEA